MAALIAIAGGAAPLHAGPAPPAAVRTTAPPSSSAAAPQAAASQAAVAPAWRVDRAEQPLVSGSAVRETVWSSARAPGGTFDRIAVHRYRGSGPSVATLLYLPGTNMNGVARLTDESHNLWVFLASRGVEVFTLDYRTRFVPASAPAADLAALRGWTTEAFVDDIRAAAALSRRESGRPRLFVAGFSRGVFLAYAYAAAGGSAAAADVEGLAGLIALDGPFKSYAPKGAFDAAGALKKLEAGNAWASDVAGGMGWDARQQLMDAVAANPAGPASNAKFPTIGDQLVNVLQFAWRPGGLANPLGGMSSPRVLATLLGGYDRYYPAIQTVEGQSIADYADDPSTTIDDRWGELKTLPILLFASTGMGGDWVLNAIYSADKSGSTDVELHVLERYGHLDVLVGEHARQDVYEPALAWLKAHATAPAAKPSAP